MITTFSKFYYGHTVTSSNNQIDFSEGGPEITAVLVIGAYTLTEYVNEIKRALDAAGALTYTVSVNRSTRLVTIAATGTFQLLVSSGTHAGTSAFSMIGFSGADRTAASSYIGNLESGSMFAPTYKLQDYVSPEVNKQSVESSVLEAANGSVQVVSFGTKSFAKMKLKYITDKPMCVPGIMKQTGPGTIQKSIDFLEYAITKAPFEFIPDEDNASNFYKVLLESTGEEKKGTAYELKELYDRNLPDFYETSLLTMRVLT